MLLYEPGGTPLDLRFRLFGTDVRVHPLFWLITALFGWPHNSRPILPGGGLGDALVFVACAFVSILLHEFGHVWMGRVFGANGHILLHGMGGLAIGSADVPHRWQRILVSAAGPAIQLVLYAVLYGLDRAGAFRSLDDADGVGQLVGSEFLRQMLWINLAWPILNLLPIWPLDGGWITREAFQIASPRKGFIVSLWVSFVVAALLALNALMWRFQPQRMVEIALALREHSRWLAAAFVRFGGLYLAILFAMLAIGSFQAIQEENSRRKRFWDDELPWER